MYGIPKRLTKGMIRLTKEVDDPAGLPVALMIECICSSSGVMWGCMWGYKVFTRKPPVITGN
jgi:hypothetical protein